MEMMLRSFWKKKAVEKVQKAVEEARAALRLIEELFHEGKSRDEVLEYIQKYYGMKESDAKELLDFAEWYLFNG